MFKSVAHIGLTVNSIDRSVAFYRDVLGLKYLGEMFMDGPETERLFDKSGCSARVAYLKTHGENNVSPVELIEFTSLKPEQSVPSLFKTSISELCFECDDIDMEYERLSGLGVKFISAPQSFDSTKYGFGKSRAVYFYDPDGNILELIQPQDDIENSKAQKYELAVCEIRDRTKGETDLNANLANTAAVLKKYMADINWVGFYLHKENQLVLGPFQGLAAVVRIEVGSGVCGTAFEKNEVQNVPDVHNFPGHIACDLSSRSEIVLPVNVNGQTVAVLDIDSPLLNRFSSTDEKYLAEIVNIIRNFWG